MRACACVFAPLSMVCAGDARRALVLLAHTPTMVYAEEYVPARARERAWCGDRACVQCAPPAGRDRPAAQRPHSRRPNVPSASVHRPWHASSPACVFLPSLLCLFVCLFVCLLFVLVGGMFATSACTAPLPPVAAAPILRSNHRPIAKRIIYERQVKHGDARGCNLQPARKQVATWAKYTRRRATRRTASMATVSC